VVTLQFWSKWNFHVLFYGEQKMFKTRQFDMQSHAFHPPFLTVSGNRNPSFDLFDQCNKVHAWIVSWPALTLIVQTFFQLECRHTHKVTDATESSVHATVIVTGIGKYSVHMLYIIVSLYSNTAQNSSNNFSSYPPDSHHSFLKCCPLKAHLKRPLNEC